MILGICESPNVLEIMNIVVTIIKVIMVVVPIILLFSLIFKAAQAATKNDQDALATLKKKAVPNIVAAVLIILVPVLVSLIVTISFPESDYTKCIAGISRESIQEAYEDKAEKLVRTAEETLNINDYSAAMNYMPNVKDDDKRESYEKRLAEVKKLIDEAKLDNAFPIKIASFNIGYFACGSSKVHCSPKVDDFVNLIVNNDIDIIGMQEAAPSNKAEEISKKSGLLNTYITHPANVNAILSKYELNNKSSTTMTCGERRSLDKTIININGIDISYYNTHLGLKSCNTGHFAKIADVLKDDPNPIIITGDFNSTSINKFNTYLLPLGFEIAAYDTSTHNLWKKQSYCDGVWILSKGHIIVAESETIDAYGKYSDHNMVIATLLIK